MTTSDPCFIGVLSRRLNLPIPTIHYYEQRGLIHPVRKQESRYRIYSQEDEKRLRFIQKAKRFGFSLEEIKALMEIRAQGTPPCISARNILKQRLLDLDQQI